MDKMEAVMLTFLSLDSVFLSLNMCPYLDKRMEY